MSDYDEPIAHHERSEGFDHSEPQVKAIWGFAAGAVVVLLLMIGALQHYFRKGMERRGVRKGPGGAQ